MKNHIFYVEQRHVRNLPEIKRSIEDATEKVKNPSEYSIEVNYSKIDSTITASSSIAFQKMLDAGFQKVIVTGLKPSHKSEALNNSVVKLLMKRGKLEIK